MRAACLLALIVVFCFLSLQVGFPGAEANRRKGAHLQLNFIKAEAGLAWRAVRAARQDATRFRTAAQGARMKALTAQKRAQASRGRARAATGQAIRAEQKVQQMSSQIRATTIQVRRALLVMERREVYSRKMERRTIRQLKKRLTTRTQQSSQIKSMHKQITYDANQTVREVRRVRRSLKLLWRLTRKLDQLIKQAQLTHHTARRLERAADVDARLMWGKKLRAASLAARAALASEHVRIARIRHQAAKKRVRVFRRRR